MLLLLFKLEIYSGKKALCNTLYRIALATDDILVSHRMIRIRKWGTCQIIQRFNDRDRTET